MQIYRSHPIVQLATLSLLSKDLTTREHLSNIGKVIKESRSKNKGIVGVIKDLCIFDSLVTASRVTYRLSKIYRRLPEYTAPGFIRYSTPGMAANLLKQSNFV